MCCLKVQWNFDYQVGLDEQKHQPDMSAHVVRCPQLHFSSSIAMESYIFVLSLKTEIEGIML